MPRTNEASLLPSAPFNDLDLDHPEDARIAAERTRLEQLGIIDSNGELVARELPPDMLPGSETTVETGCTAMPRPRMISVPHAEMHPRWKNHNTRCCSLLNELRDLVASLGPAPPTPLGPTERAS